MFSNQHGFLGAASSLHRKKIYTTLSLRHDGKFSEVLEFIFVLKQALTTDSQAWYHLCTRDSCIFSPVRCIKLSFPVTNTGTCPHRASHSDGCSVREHFCSPGTMGSFPLRPWWDFTAFVCSGLCGLPEFLPYKSTNAPLLHGAWLITCYWLSWGNTDLILSALKHFILHSSLNISLSSPSAGKCLGRGRAYEATEPRSPVFFLIKLLVFFYVARQCLTHS